MSQPSAQQLEECLKSIRPSEIGRFVFELLIYTKELCRSLCQSMVQKFSLIFQILLFVRKPDFHSQSFYLIVRVATIHFYSPNDISLGSFLRRYCFDPEYNCPVK